MRHTSRSSLIVACPTRHLILPSSLCAQIIAGSEYATLATVSDDGSPTCRTIWVRDLYHTRALLFTTDARTPKVRQLAPPPSPSSPPSSPPASPAEVCWFLPMAKEQFNIAVHPTLITHTHPSPTLQQLRRAVWSSSPDWLQVSFDSPPPGCPKHSSAHPPTPPAHAGQVHERFVVVLLWPVRCDYLRLPITVIDNTRPLHRESRLKPQKERQRWLHTRHAHDRWSVTQLNP